MLRPLIAIVLALAGTAPALADKPHDTLKVAFPRRLETLDPYRGASRDAMAVAAMLFDTLIHRDPETLAYGPGLAASWRLTDPRTIELTLRDGVVFHNGEELDADDVVHTVEYVVQNRNELAAPDLFEWLEGAEKLDRLSVRLKLSHPFAPVLEYLATVLPILPNVYHSGAAPEAFARAPVGTGPYSFGRSRDPDLLVFERFDRHFGGSLKGKPAIRYVQIRTITDENARLAELVAGGVEWIGETTRERVEQAARIGYLQATVNDSLWIGLLAVRSAEGKPLGDPRVRRAILHAIDRRKLAQMQIGIDGRHLSAPCHPRQTGCDASAAPAYDYSPRRARELLKEAGLAAGFDTVLTGFGDRALLEGVQADLGAVGIRAAGRPEDPAARPGRLPDGDYQIAYLRWGSWGLMDVAATLDFFFDGQGYDLANDADLARMIAAAAGEAKPELRKAAYGKAIQRIMEQAHVVPLFALPTRWTMAKGLKLPAFVDAVPRFYLAVWE